MYSVGRARRFVAGNFWCAEKKNQGKLPCLHCRGRGTVEGKACPHCRLTGWESDEQYWYLWFRLWVQREYKGRQDDETFPCRPTLRSFIQPCARRHREDDGESKTGWETV